MKAIKVDNLTKSFGHIIAVDCISFGVEEGHIFGFLGPNGAGKTTTIMILATALNPTSGSATICGNDIIRERGKVRESISIVFEELSLDINLTGRENLDFHARMYHLDKQTRDERVSQALDLIGLRDRQDTLVKYYSGGMQRRLEIARGMLNYPKVLFLDEPTLGLDVQTRRLLWDYVRKLNREIGTTVLLNTHYIEEADYLCDKIAILDRGKIMIMDTPERLKDFVGSSLISIKLVQETQLTDLYELLKEPSWIRKVNHRDNWLEISVEGGGIGMPKVVRLAQQHGFAISSISERKPSLEDAFLYYAGKRLESEEYA